MRLHGCSRYRWAAVAALLLLPGAAAWAQGGAAAAASTKYAVINVKQAIVTTAEGKQASAQLQSNSLRGKASWRVFRSRLMTSPTA